MQATTMLRMVGQISPLIPFAGPLQPLIELVVQLLERGQLLSEGEQQLKALALRSGKMTLALHNRLKDQTDHLSEEIRNSIDDLCELFRLVVKQFDKIGRMSPWKRMFYSRNVTEVIMNLSTEVQNAMTDLMVLTSIDTHAGVNVLLNAHSHALSLQESQETLTNSTTSIATFASSTSTLSRVNAIHNVDGLPVFSRFDILLKDTISLKKFDVYGEKGETLEIHSLEGRVNGVHPVLIKRFEGTNIRLKAKAFAEEIRRSRQIWSTKYIQVMGRSPAGEESPYIVYHFPEQQSRISFIDLWFRCIDQDVNILLGMVDQLPGLLNEWKKTFECVPIDDNRQQHTSIRSWLENMAVQGEGFNTRGRQQILYTGELSYCADIEQKKARMTDLEWCHFSFRFCTFLWVSCLIHRVAGQDTTGPWPLPHGELDSALSTLLGALIPDLCFYTKSTPQLEIDGKRIYMHGRAVWKEFHRSDRGDRALYFRDYGYDLSLRCFRATVYDWSEKKERGSYWEECACIGRDCHPTGPVTEFSTIKVIWDDEVWPDDLDRITEVPSDADT